MNNVNNEIENTYQLLNHQVSPEDDALECSACHMNTARIAGNVIISTVNP